MSAEDLDNYETDAELALYKEYRDVIKLFTYVVETERRFYLANKVDFNVRSAGQDVYFDVQLTDAWVWDVYRSSRFVKNVRIVTFKDVNVEEVQKTDIDIPDERSARPWPWNPMANTTAASSRMWHQAPQPWHPIAKLRKGTSRSIPKAWPVTDHAACPATSMMRC